MRQMSTPRALAMACALVASATISATAAPPAHEPSVAVTFTQLDWLGPQGEVKMECSPIIEAEFSLRRNDTIFLGTEGGGGGGWINIVTHVPDSPEPEQWSVQNLRFSFPDVRYMAASSPSVQFGLGTIPGTCLSSIDYAVFVSAEPMTVLPPQLTYETGRVLDDDYLAGGRVSADGLTVGGTGYAQIELWPDPWKGWPPLPAPPPPPLPIPTRWAAQSVKGIEAVAELIDGCAPAAATRSLQYLLDNAGEKAPRTTDMYDDLIDEMGTAVNGGGTTDDGIEAGKDSYANHEGLPIDTSRSYGAASFGEAFNNLGNGGDVELLIAWDPQPTPTTPGGGGHCAMVTSMTQYPDGSYDITYVDDPDQSDGRAENAEHVIHVDAGGTFPGGQVDGFVNESHQ